MAIQDADVLIAGGGPTGLMLGAELALAGIDVAIVERRPSQELAGSRSGGLHARTIEILDQRGIGDRFVAEGEIAQVAGFAGTQLDIGDFPTRRNYGLALWQKHIERILAGWVGELGVPIHYGVEVTGLAEDASGVSLALSGGRSPRARYLVGCDGGRSLVRKAAGIAFPGTDATTSNIIAEAEFAEEPAEWGIRRDAIGIHALRKVDDGRVGVLVTEKSARATGEPTLAELSAAMIAVWGTDYGIHSPTSLGRFTDMTRQAAAYRKGRVLIAGDAAHIHPPDGGQGLQLGIGDAVNLGWKLALVVAGTAAETLLDTYQAERHPVAEWVLRNTMASVAIRRDDERTSALRDLLGDLLRLDQPRRELAGRLSGLSIHYDLGPGHPLLGRRMPDLDIETRDGPVRVYTLLHPARPLLFNFSRTSPPELGPWAGRVEAIDAGYDGPWELPVIGAVTAPAAVLVRPDGYVVWVDDGGADGLREALATWFGPGS
ncbi:MAG: FAD-dependent monooxygenase [Bauldia sp.]